MTGQSNADATLVDYFDGQFAPLGRRYHLVKQWQELFLASVIAKLICQTILIFAVLARAFGIPAITVERRDQVDDAIE